MKFLDQNMIEPGDEFITASIMKEINFRENLRLAVEGIGWNPLRSPRPSPMFHVGRAYPSPSKSTVTPTTSSAFIKVNNDASVSVLCSNGGHGAGFGRGHGADCRRDPGRGL